MTNSHASIAFTGPNVSHGVCQLRIYRVKPGLINQWVSFFRDTLIPLHDLVGLRVRAAWVNPEDPDEFVWIREFESLESIEMQEREFFSTPERRALGDVRGDWLSSLDVRVLSPVFDGETSGNVRTS